jgi:hypothetical protein
MMVHNFIRVTQVYKDEFYNENDVPDAPDDDNVPEVEMGGNLRALHQWRNEIARAMWDDYVLHNANLEL